MRHTKAILAATLLAASARVAWAQPIDGASMLAQRLGAACRSAVPGLINRPEAAPVLNLAPVDTDLVCTCTEKSVMADERFVSLLQGDQQDVLQRLNSPRTKAYGQLLLMKSMFACLAPAIESSLDRVAPHE